MKNLNEIIVRQHQTLHETIQIIDASAAQVALVVDDAMKLCGIVTDGDVRRAILRGTGLQAPIREVMNAEPHTALISDDHESLLAQMRLHGLRQLPIVDQNRTLLGIEFLEDLTRPASRENLVVLMAGGLGSRLKSLTENCPKPMLSVGDKPLLETIIDNFVAYGFHNFAISVNYLAEHITGYFGDGSRLGVRIQYLQEETRLGTAGALSLMAQQPEKPLIVMNGDVLTKVNFPQLLAFHDDHEAMATMCVREYDFQVPYGVVEMDNYRIRDIREKPVHSFFVNAGIYVLSPAAVAMIPAGRAYDMPSLFQEIIAKHQITAAFPIREYWIDIGQMADYERANGDYPKVFAP